MLLFELDWFSLAVMSSILVSLVGIFQKKALTAGESNPVAFSIFFQLLVGITAIPFGGKNLGQISLNIKLIVGLIAVSLIYVFSNIIYNYSLKQIELSETSIISSTKPLWLLFGSYIVFHESLDLRKIYGVIFVVLGLLILYWKKSGHINFGKPQMLVMLSAILLSIAALLDKYLISYFSEPSTYIILTFLIPSVLTAVIFPKQAVQTISFIRFEMRTLFIVLGAVILNLASYIYFSSIKLGGEVSRTGTIWQASTVFTVILSMLFLSERRNWLNKILGVLIVFLGIVLIK